MTANAGTYKIDFELVMLALAAVFLTFFLHEAALYLTGKSLGYDMWMRLNGVGIADGQTYDTAEDTNFHKCINAEE